MRSRKTWYALGASGLGLAALLVLAAVGRKSPDLPTPKPFSHGHRSDPAPLAETPSTDPTTPSAPLTPDDPASTRANESKKNRSAVRDLVQKTNSESVKEKRIASYRKNVLDETHNPAQRTRDLHSLHQLGGVTPEVEESMIKVLRASQEDVIRERIMIGLEGNVSPVLKAESLRLLEGDAAARVRQAAARALMPMRSDPAVQQALQTASVKDFNEDVRRECARVLSKGEPRSTSKESTPQK